MKLVFLHPLFWWQPSPELLAHHHNPWIFARIMLGFTQSQVIAHTYDYVRRFRQILTEREETALQSWACEAEAGQIPALVRFVQRLRLDWEAIENALLFASSQGQVEGQVNRLKVFKRQGYGRMSPALLQARLIGASGLSRNAS